MKLGELFFELGFHADTMKLKDFGRAVADLNMTSILTAGSFGALYESAKQLIDVAHGMGDAVNRFTLTTGGSSDALQRWQGVAASAGVAGDVITDTLTQIADAEAKIQTGQAPNALFGNLGLVPSLVAQQDPGVVYGKLLQRLQNMPVLKARSYLEGLGLSTDLLRITQQIPDLQKSYNDQAILSVNQLAMLNQNTNLMKQTSRDLNLSWAELGTSILPGINSLLEKINQTLSHMQLSPDMKNLLGIIGKFSFFTGKTIAESAKGWGYVANLGMTGDINGRGVNPFSSVLALLNNNQPDYSGYNKANSLLPQANQITQTNHITVQGSDDPHATAKAIDERIGKHINQALAAGSTGGW